MTFVSNSISIRIHFSGDPQWEQPTVEVSMQRMELRQPDVLQKPRNVLQDSRIGAIRNHFPMQQFLSFRLIYPAPHYSTTNRNVA